MPHQKPFKLSVEEVKALRKAGGWGITNKAAAEKALRSKRKQAALKNLNF